MARSKSKHKIKKLRFKRRGKRRAKAKNAKKDEI